jgi:Rrf2 family protein
MLITREMDYGIRVVRELCHKDLCSAAEISDSEGIPMAFAYKILKKLEQNDIVEVVRGKNGGYRLTRPCSELTLYDMISAVDRQVLITECMAEGYCCTSPQGPRCTVHNELMRIQDIVVTELKRNTLDTVFQDEN